MFTWQIHAAFALLEVAVADRAHVFLLLLLRITVIFVLGNWKLINFLFGHTGLSGWPRSACEKSNEGTGIKYNNSPLRVHASLERVVIHDRGGSAVWEAHHHSHKIHCWIFPSSSLVDDPEDSWRYIFLLFDLLYHLISHWLLPSWLGLWPRLLGSALVLFTSVRYLRLLSSWLRSDSIIIFSKVSILL